MELPLIDTARFKFRGLSSESFERRELGSEVVFTIKGVIVKDESDVQAHEGNRISQTVKIERVVEGVSDTVHESGDGQLSMADVPADDDEDEPEDEDVVPIGGGRGGFVGPTFSSTDE